MTKRFISTNALSKRWEMPWRAARDVMERSGAKPILYGARSTRWLMSDVEAVEAGSIPTPLAKQLRDLIRR